VTAVNDPARPDARSIAAPRAAVTAWSQARGWKPLPHVLLAAAFALAWTVLSICRTLRGDDMSYDTAIFSEAVKGWATLGAPIADIKGAGYNLLGDHWSPILAILAPVWWVWPSPLMLVTVQALLFGWSVGVVSDTAARSTTRGRGVAIGLAYGLSFGLQRAVDSGFHEIAFAVPLLALVMRQLLRGRPERAVYWALPLLLVKEDLGLTVAALGVLIAVRRPHRWLGLLLAVIGLASTVADVLVFIPHFNAGHRYDYWAKVPGGSLAHVGGWRLVLGLVWPLIKWQTFGWTVGVTGFLCLRSHYMALAAPMLLWRFTSSNPIYWGTSWHYGAPLMPIVFLAAVDGLGRLEVSRVRWQRRYWFQVVPVMVAAGVACTVALPLGVTGLVNAGTYPFGGRASAMAAADAVIPPGVVVSADVAQGSLLAARDRVFFVGDSKVDAKRPDFIAMDAGWWRPSMDLVGWASQRYSGARYRIVFQRGDFTVLRFVSAVP
jgi:uncharacterized membrane protein